MSVEFSIAIEECASGNATKLVALMRKRTKLSDDERDSLADLIEDGRVRRRYHALDLLPMVHCIESNEGDLVDSDFSTAVHCCEENSSKCDQLTTLLRDDSRVIAPGELNMLVDLAAFLAATASHKVARGRPSGTAALTGIEERRMGFEYRRAINIDKEKEVAVRKRIAEQYGTSESTVRATGDIMQRVWRTLLERFPEQFSDDAAVASWLEKQLR